MVKECRNILVFSMSTFTRDEEVVYECPTLQGTELIEKHEEESQVTAPCKHTNEGVVRYLVQKLKEKGEKIDSIYAFVTEKVRNDKVVFRQKDQPAIVLAETHKELFDQRIKELGLHVNGVSLEDEKELELAYTDLANMLLKLEEEIEKFDGITRIHFDMTGGRRHATALILTLMNILKYYGSAELGEVLYAELNQDNKKRDENNRSIGKIYDAKALIDMFSLVGGAEEFTSFGSVEQILQFFSVKEADGKQHIDSNLSEELKTLLESMQTLSNMFKLSCSFEVMKEALEKVQNAMDVFKESMEDGKVSPKEVFFARLLPIIEHEYGTLLSYNTSLKEVDLINWCLNKDMLQQALTYYTEWIPAYIGKNMLTIDESVFDKCKDHAAEYSDGYIYLFRTYESTDDSAFKYFQSFNKSRGVKDLTTIFNTFFNSKDNFSLDPIINGLAEEVPIKKFLQQAQHFIYQNKEQNTFFNRLKLLPKKDLLRRILCLSKDNKSMDQIKVEDVVKDIRSRIIEYNKKEYERKIKNTAQTEHILQYIVATSLNILLNKSLAYHNAQKGSKDEDSSVSIQNGYSTGFSSELEGLLTELGLTLHEVHGEETIEEKANRRKKVIKGLLKRKKILLKDSLREDSLVDFIEEYFIHVNMWRNTMNHAHYSDYHHMDARSIRDDIKNNLARLEA